MISPEDREMLDDIKIGIIGNIDIGQLITRLSPEEMLELAVISKPDIQINLALHLPPEYLPKMLEIRGMKVHPAALIEIAGRMDVASLPLLKRYLFHYGKGKGMAIYTADMLKEVLAARMLPGDKIFLMRDRDEGIAELSLCPSCQKRKEEINQSY